MMAVEFRGRNSDQKNLLPPFYCLPPGRITSRGDAENNAISTLDTAFADPDMETIRQKLKKMTPNGRHYRLVMRLSG